MQSKYHLNQCHFWGNIADEPVILKIPTGRMVIIKVAVNEVDAKGENVKTNFIPVRFLNKYADAMLKAGLDKGDYVHLMGRLDIEGPKKDKHGVWRTYVNISPEKFINVSKMSKGIKCDPIVRDEEEPDFPL